MEEEIAAEMLRAGMNTRAEFIAYVREKFFKEYDKEVVFGDKYKSSHQVQMFCAGCDFEIRGRKSVGNKSDGLFHLVEKPCQLVHKKIVKGVEYPCDSSFLTHKKREAKEKISHSSIESEGLQAEERIVLEGVKKPRIAAAAAELSVPIDEEWKLYYWSGNFKGRGEYIRLMFEAAEVPYEEVGDAEHILKLMDRNGRGEAPFPAFAPPMISGPGGVFLSQTPVCMARLGKAFGLYPQNEEDEFKALQIVLSVADYHGEGRSSFHPVDNTASYLTQVEEAKITTAKFAEGRMKTWLHHFEHLLSVSKSSYFVGSSMTYVDIAVFYALWATETQFPIEWGALDIPSLKAFKQRIASYRPIAAYLKSGRGRPFSGDSML